MIGRTLSHYKVLGEISRGGMGIVYRATDVKLNRDVALKVLPPELVSDPERKRRFVQEAQAAAALKHPNIAHVYEIDEFDGVDFIAFELIEGEKLSVILDREPLSAQRTMDVVVDVAEGLAKAHSKGIVHRDIKPANIMITDDGHTKIIDFGLAKLVEPLPEPNEELAPGTRRETAAGQVMGTLAYMSPEQVRGQSVDHRSDVFSLGVVLYEMLSGDLPFKAASAAEIPHATINDPTPPLPSTSPVPSQILELCLAKSPTARYQSTKQLADELRDVIRRSDAELPMPVWIRPRRWPLPIGAVVAILLVLSFGWLRFNSNKSTATNSSLAVLPFENTRNDPDVDYLGDGIAETLINHLAQLPQLRVMARSTSFRYRGADIDPTNVGRELAVGVVLTGRVVHQGEQLNVQAELVDVATGNQLWGDQYNRNVADILDLQKVMAREISDALRLELTSADQLQLAEYGTENSGAYRSYLKGRFFAGKRTHADFVKAIQFFEDAKRIDPEYALAYVGLADSHLLTGAYNPGPDTIRSAEMEKGREAATEALRLNPDLADAYTSLGYIEFLFDWDWDSAERDFLKAIELDPSYAVAYQWYGEFLSVMGRHDEAIERTQRAVELEPTSAIISRELGYKFVMARRFPEAIAQFQKTIELDASFSGTNGMLTEVYWYSGLVDEAVAQAQHLNEPTRRYYEALGRGDNDAAVEWIEAAVKTGQTLTVASRQYAVAGFKEKSLDLLEASVNQRIPQVLVGQAQPAFDPYRSDPRFIAVRKKIGLDP